MQILDATTLAAVAAATSQQAQCEALIAAWAGGNVTARIYAASTLLRTLTIAPFTIDTQASPREVVCGANAADTAVDVGTPTRVVFRSGSTDIFEMTAGTSGADINFEGDIKTLCSPKLAGGSAGVVFTANPSLPATDTPAWASALTLWEWDELANTALEDTPISGTYYGSPANRIDGYGGACMDTLRKRYIIANPGGHSDLSANCVNALLLNQATPAWVELRGPSAEADQINRAAFYLDGRPASAHLYCAQHYIPSLDAVATFCRGGIQAFSELDTATSANPYYSSGLGDTGDVNDRFSKLFLCATNDFEQAPTPTIADFPTRFSSDSAVTMLNPATEDCIVMTPANGNWHKWTRAANTWATSVWANIANGAAALIDPVRGHVVWAGSTSEAEGPNVVDLSDGTTLAVKTDFPDYELIEDAQGQGSAIYDAEGDRGIFVFNGATQVEVRCIDLDTLAVTSPTITGTKPTNRTNGMHNAAQLVEFEEIAVVVLANAHDENVKVLRVR